MNGNNRTEIMDWDYDALSENIKEMKALNSRIAKIFKEVKTEIESLQGEWIANTADQVFQNFEKANKIFEQINVERQNDVNFAETSNEHYKSMEESINSFVDTKVDI